jgi:hypothetical protein
MGLNRNLGNLTEVITEEGGNIGIGGTPNAGFRVDVNGTGRFGGQLNVGAGGLAGMLGVRGTTNDSSAFAFEAANSSGNSLFLVRNDGNVGIGTVPQTLTHLYTATARAIPALGSAGGHFMIQTGGVIATIMGVNANGNFYIQPQHINNGGSVVYNTLLNPSGGNVAVGINYSPTAKLHVEGQDIYLTGNTDNRIRFSNFGFTGNSMGAAIGYIYRIANTQESGGLAFYTNPNSVGPASMAERMRITPDGLVLMPFVYSNTSGGAANVGIAADGNLYRSTSSLKYKKNVENYQKGLDEIMQMRPVTYNSVNESEEGVQYAGLIAEEIHELGLTEFVQYANDGTPDALAYSNIVSLLIKGIQELKAEIEILKQNK